MSPIITIITAAAVWLHVVVGCCAHHSHDAHGETCHHHAVESVEGSHADHDCDADHPSDEAPCPTERCSESHCVFLAVGKTGFSRLTTLALLPISTSERVGAFVASPAVALVASGGLIEPPVRLHLFHQVLVI